MSSPREAQTQANALRSATPPTDLTNLSHAELIARIASLESRLKSTTDQLAFLRSRATNTNANTNTNINSTPPTPSITASPSSPTPNPKFKLKPKKKPKPFDFSAYHTRRIALRFSYIGGPYNGYEHANNETSAPPRPTVEEVLWKALRKIRLIDPPVAPGADDSYEVTWDERKRALRYGAGNGKGQGEQKLALNWEGVGYSKCGRTDRGVSAFGQVVGLTVRSAQPRERKKTKAEAKVVVAVPEEAGEGSYIVAENAAEVVKDSGSTSVGNDGAEKEQNGETVESDTKPAWDSVRDELPYITLLNAVLPSTIRVLAWCPDPPSDFDARFSCTGRRYKYFFTNPAFCPVPGPLGLQAPDGRPTGMRDGWLDIDAMRKAAKKLEGLHDYRNFCKIDASKQMPSCERRIRFADIEEFEDGMDAFASDSRLNQTGSQIGGALAGIVNRTVSTTQAPKVYAFVVDGTAFLWHQVRCMVAVLFLVGQGLEKPEIVDELLDTAKNPRRPTYEMADDGPLVLWDCFFTQGDDSDKQALQWVYAGDAAALGPLAPRADSKFGPAGVTTSLWADWQQAKINETLAAGLLGLSLKQGDDSAFDRGGVAAPELGIPSQRVFSGGPLPRLVGLYQPVMNRPMLDTLEVQNEKYRIGKQARQSAKRSQQAEAGEGE